MLRNILLRFGCKTLKWRARLVATCSASRLKAFSRVISNAKISHSNVACLKVLLKLVWIFFLDKQDY